MTSKISLRELREAIDHDPFPEQQNFKMCAVEVLALVEAVEAAQAYEAEMGKIANEWRQDWSEFDGRTLMHQVSGASQPLNTALARFKDYA